MAGIRLPIRQIGGGRVVRAFNAGGKRIPVGTTLSREDMMAFQPANLHCLIDKNYIAVWPRSGDAVSPPASTGSGRATEGDDVGNHVVALGFGRYDVIAGRKINDGPLNRAAAYALAGLPEPEVKKRA